MSLSFVANGGRHAEKVITAKQKAFKAWKTGKGTRASYDAAGQQSAYKRIIENKMNLVHKMFRVYLAFLECRPPFATKDKDITHRL